MKRLIKKSNNYNEEQLQDLRSTYQKFCKKMISDLDRSGLLGYTDDEIAHICRELRKNTEEAEKIKKYILYINNECTDINDIYNIARRVRFDMGYC